MASLLAVICFNLVRGSLLVILVLLDVNQTENMQTNAMKITVETKQSDIFSLDLLGRPVLFPINRSNTGLEFSPFISIFIIIVTDKLF